MILNKDKAKETQPKDQSKKIRRAWARRARANTLMGIIVFCGLLGCLVAYSLVTVILTKTDVELNVDDLASSEVSMIYDDQGELITTVGTENRINVSYASMPQSLIDAFISVEDSRYFEHPGFDMPRFAKAFLEDIVAMDFSQGGSTITMQSIKNTYFAVDTIAEKSISRKVLEIYYSLKITKIVSKQKVLELYINKINFGSSARGAQVASQYYFGKNCTDLSLVESAMLAGIVNSPNYNNPYYHLDHCIDRTKEVLYLMNYHGYITDLEYELAKQVDIANLLVGSSARGGSLQDGTTIPNQAYVDVVLDEIQDIYGIDPYTTAVRIYTGLNRTVQDYCDSVANGDYHKWKDDHINCGFTAVQNNTGLVVGVCGGRNYNGERIFNYAVDTRINIGSTSKAILTYPLAFEYCDLATSYYVTDEPVNWTGTRYWVKNDTGKYYGDVSIQRAFSCSYNIPSIKLYKWIRSTIGESKMASYLSSMGFDDSVVSQLNEQYSIGGSEFLASPLQLAAAESAIFSGGRYTTPHTITRIEFINSTKEPINANFSSTQVLSEGAAWLDVYIQGLAVNGGGTASDMAVTSRLRKISKSAYRVHGKTGTASLSKVLKSKYKYPSSAGTDIWMIAATSDFSCALWIGYDTGSYVDKTTYMTTNERHAGWDSKIMNGLLNSLASAYGNPKKGEIAKPKDVTSITHLIGFYPYTSAPSYAPKGTTITGYVKSSFASLQTYEPPMISSISSFSASAKTNDGKQTLTVSWGLYPDETMRTTAGTTKVGANNKTVKRSYDDTWVAGYAQYRVIIRDSNNNVVATYTSDSNSATYTLPAYQNDTTLYVTGYYVYSISGTQSNSITQSVRVTGLHQNQTTPTE